MGRQSPLILEGLADSCESELTKARPLILDLLRGDSYFKLSSSPSSLEELIQPKHKVVIIDEIQRVPELLNEVHRLIEDRGIRFILTGSSARRLKRSDANLLAGRAWNAQFFPLVYPEYIQTGPFDLKKMLRYGCLPRVFQGADPLEELDGYVTTYLQEEIERERWVRSIPKFSRFLKTAALTSGELLNYANLSSDTGVSGVTIKEYYQRSGDRPIKRRWTSLWGKVSPSRSRLPANSTRDF